MRTRRGRFYSTDLLSNETNVFCFEERKESNVLQWFLPLWALLMPLGYSSRLLQRKQSLQLWICKWPSKSTEQSRMGQHWVGTYWNKRVGAWRRIYLLWTNIYLHLKILLMQLWLCQEILAERIFKKNLLRQPDASRHGEHSVLLP